MAQHEPKEKKPPNIAEKPEVFKDFLTQNVIAFLGNFLRALGVAFTTHELGQMILQHTANLVGEKSVGVIITEVTAAGRTAIRHYVSSVFLREVLSEILDEFLDGVRETWMKQNGRLTEADVHAAAKHAATDTAKALKEIRTMAEALRRLPATELTQFLARAAAFCADENRAKKFKVWRGKLTEPDILKQLANLDMVLWEGRLIALYGDVTPSQLSKQVSKAWTWTKQTAAQIWAIMQMAVDGDVIEAVQQWAADYATARNESTDALVADDLVPRLRLLRR